MNKETIYHFTGIKGSGMSALALVLHGAGYKVQGSDVETYFFTQQGLEAADIRLLTFDPNNIHEGMEIILGNAFPDDHPEVKKAKALGLKVTRYHKFLGELIKHYTSVAITGSHGKTSTTGLMSHVLSLNVPTSYLIGDGTGYGDEAAEYFVLEADEYREHFLAYEPDYAIFTNIDFDHPDYYQNIDQVFAANSQFASQVQKKAIMYGDDPYLQRLADKDHVLYYGIEGDYDIVAHHVVRDTTGCQFDVEVQGKDYGHFQIKGCGEHNILNSLAVIGFCCLEDFPADKVQEALLSFAGVKRRLNVTEVADMILVDDYAHHPSEITATLDAAKQRYPEKKIIAVFQPHTYSRTLALMDEFAQALDQADEVFLCEIFASAREQDTHQVSSEDLAAKVTKPVQILDLDDMSPLMGYHDAVVLFMGAGDVPKYGRAYAEALKSR